MGNTLMVATASQGIIRSSDDGASWHRLGLRQPIEFDGVVRSLVLDPRDSRTVYAGADVGLCRSDDVGSEWTLMNTPFRGETVWKVAIDVNNTRRMFVGTGAPSRAALWRSEDGGDTWVRVGPEIPEFCAGVNRPRVLAFAFNPVDVREAWFGLEAGGLFRTRDGGDHWERLDERLQWDYHADVHAVQVLRDDLQTVVVVCVNAVYVSRDRGETWEGMLPKTEFGLYYARALAVSPRSKQTLYVSLSDGTPGTKSSIIMSEDSGRTWQMTRLDKEAGSCFWSIHANPNNPDEMLTGTKYGDLYLSADGGRTWKKQWRSFPEITDVLWVPVAADIKAAHRSDVA